MRASLAFRRALPQ